MKAADHVMLSGVLKASGEPWNLVSGVGCRFFLYFSLPLDGQAVMVDTWRNECGISISMLELRVRVSSGWQRVILPAWYQLDSSLVSVLEFSIGRVLEQHHCLSVSIPAEGMGKECLIIWSNKSRQQLETFLFCHHGKTILFKSVISKCKAF